MNPTFFSHYGSRNQLARLFLAFFLLPVVTDFAAVDRVRIIVENDVKKPGQAQVYFPHLRKWLPSNQAGIIILPEPYGERKLIEVLPRMPDIYGPQFNRPFPVEDGIVSLKAIPVTAAIRAKALQLKSENKPAEAATAFALAARRVEVTDQAEATKNQRMAYESLAQKYGVSPGYVGDGGTLRASPQLVAAINAKLGNSVVPADGRFSVGDFKKAAEMKSLSSIVTATQEKFFDKRSN